MKVTLFMVAGLLLLFGSVWTLQGFNILAGSVMSGHPFWIFAGAGAVIGGVVLGILGTRVKKK